MARSSSVSLEEKMDELELGGKMRKSHDMRSEMNLAQQQLVGFGMLPDQVTASRQEVVTLMVMVLQVYSKAVRKGFEFSLMVVGASGLGKSTLVNSMFLTDIYADEKEPGKQELVQKQQEGGEGDSRQTLKVEAHHKVLVENGVKLSLTVRIMS